MTLVQNLLQQLNGNKTLPPLDCLIYGLLFEVFNGIKLPLEQGL